MVTTFRRLAVLAGALVLASAAAIPAASAAPAPVVTSVTPAADTTGSQVVVSGSNLTLPPKLKPDAIFFGQVKAVINSCAPLTGAASSCNVTVPPQCPGAPKRVDVRVVVGNLESAISSGDGFTYTDSEGGTASPCPTPSSTATGTPTPTPSPSVTSTAPGPSPSASSTTPAPFPSGPPGTGAGGSLHSGHGPLAVALIPLVAITALGVTGLIRRRRARSR
jgi:hypothetical protein